MLGDNTIEMTGGILQAPSFKPLTIDNNRVIWMFPVYSWGIPPVMENILNRIKFSSGHSKIQPAHHLVLTCGDDIGLTDKSWRKIIRSRHFADGLTFSVQMPNTYVLMKGFDTDSTDIEERKITAARPRLEYIADTISRYVAGDTYNDVVRGSFAWIKSRIIRPWFVRHAMSPKPFGINDKCISCGLCAKSCPMANIVMNSHKHPHWSRNCALCLRCYHACPTHAICYGKATKGKHQYNRFTNLFYKH